MKIPAPLLWLIAAGILIGSTVLIIYLPLLQWADQLALWVPQNYTFSLIAFVFILIVWALLVPTMVPIILAGYFFGFWQGFLVVYCATTTAFAIAFFMTRKLFFHPFQNWLAQRPRCRSFIDCMEGAGWKLVVWMRISPIIPFHMQNYCYGASTMPFRTCLWSTLIGKAPGITVTVLLGVVARSSADGIRGISDAKESWWWHAMMILAFVAASYVSYLVVSAAKKAIKIQTGASLDAPDSEQDHQDRQRPQQAAD